MCSCPGPTRFHRTIERIQGLGLPGKPVVLSLSARTAVEEQDRCFRRESQRRVIVATNVAETSITLPHVVAVVDSGLARVLRFDARRGLERLGVEGISLASATQRAGRAGRTAPGVCVRLWSEAEEKGRAAFETPEVLRADLTEWVLRLEAMGLRAEEVRWLDAPEPHALEHARRVLGELGALDDFGFLTQLGQIMASARVHPRLARCLLDASEGDVEEVALWCALLAEDVPWRSTPGELASEMELPGGKRPGGVGRGDSAWPLGREGPDGV